MNKGYYMIIIEREENKMTKNVTTYLEIKEVSVFGGNFKVVATVHHLTAFFLLLGVFTISYIHRLKFREEKLKDKQDNT